MNKTHTEQEKEQKKPVSFREYILKEKEKQNKENRSR